MGTSQEGLDEYDVDNEYPYRVGTTAGGLGSASASGSSNIQSYQNTKSKSGSRRSGGGGKPRKDNSSWKGQDGSSSGGGSSKPTPQTMSGKTQTESDLTQQEESKHYGKMGPGSTKRRSGKNRNRKVFHPSEINYAKSESQGKRTGNQKYTGYEEDYDQEL